MGKINTDNYPNRPFSSYQDDDMFILQDNGGETYTTNVGDIKTLVDNRVNDSNLVHKTGDETILGNKTFEDDINVEGGITAGTTSTFNDIDLDGSSISGVSTLNVNQIDVHDGQAVEFLTDIIVNGDVTDEDGNVLSNKTDKVANATSGHLAGLDSNGNLTDSGVSPTEDVTVEGNPVTFESPFEQDAKSVVVSVEPIQDLHGYDHPWVGGAGKNKMYCELQLPYDTGKGIVVTSDGNGGVYLNGTSTDGIIIGNVFKTDALTGQSTFCKLTSAEPDGLVYIGHWPNGDYYSSIAGFETAGTDGYWEMGIYFSNSGIVCNNVHLTPMVIMGDTHDADYAPYSNICPISGIDEVEIEVSDGESEPTTTTIPLPSTLYDADVDVTEGSGNSTHAIVDLSTLSWTLGSGKRWATSPINTMKSVGDSTVANAYCSTLPIDTKNNITNDESIIALSINSTSQIIARNGSETDPPTGQLVYELATPTTISFDPTDVELLEGTNVVTTNGEKVAVTYGRSLWQDIDELKTDTEGKLDKSDVATIEGDTASRPYSVNEFMLRADGFYKVTQPIAQNASITASNTTKTTVGEVLTALLNA